jgi:hypothetical protein
MLERTYLATRRRVSPVHRVQVSQSHPRHRTRRARDDRAQRVGGGGPRRQRGPARTGCGGARVRPAKHRVRARRGPEPGHGPPAAVAGAGPDGAAAVGPLLADLLGLLRLLELDDVLLGLLEPEVAAEPDEELET